MSPNSFIVCKAINLANNMLISACLITFAEGSVIVEFNVLPPKKNVIYVFTIYEYGSNAIFPFKI